MDGRELSQWMNLNAEDLTFPAKRVLREIIHELQKTDGLIVLDRDDQDDLTKKSDADPSAVARRLRARFGLE